MRVHDDHKHGNEFLLEARRHFLEDIFEVFDSEGLNEVNHGALLLLLNPHLLEGLEQVLVELGHYSEAGSLVEKVELFVVFVSSDYLVLLHLGRGGVDWI